MRTHNFKKENWNLIETTTESIRMIFENFINYASRIHDADPCRVGIVTMGRAVEVCSARGSFNINDFNLRIKI